MARRRNSSDSIGIIKLLATSFSSYSIRWWRRNCGVVSSRIGGDDGDFHGANANTEASKGSSADNKESEQEMRKSLQLKLMTLKLQEGSNIEPDALLRLFISKGVVTPADEPFYQDWQRFCPTFDRH